MLNIIRITVIILGALSLIVALTDHYGVFGFSIKNKIFKYIVYCVFIICAVFFEADGFISLFTGL